MKEPAKADSRKPTGENIFISRFIDFKPENIYGFLKRLFIKKPLRKNISEAVFFLPFSARGRPLLKLFVRRQDVMGPLQQMLLTFVVVNTGSPVIIR